MAKKLLKSLKNNLGLKILSVVIAIIIWYVVVDVNDPVETSTYQVRVTPANESYIENGKQIYRIDDAYKTVQVYVKGNRSKLKKVTADNISVIADLTQIVDLNKDPVMVPLTATAPGISSANITLSRTTIPITIENIASVELPVSVDVGSSVPGTDFEIGSLTPNPETIIINGPESVINKLGSVIATTDVTGMTADGTKEASLKLLDKNGEEVSEDTIQDDLTFDGGVPEETVIVDLWSKASDIGFDVQYAGTPAQGYQVGSISTTPATVTLAGTDKALEGIEESGSKLTIPSDLITVAGASTDVTATVKMSDILPEDTKLATGQADTVTVKITILKNDSKEMSLDVDNIATEALASDLTIGYDQSELKFIVEGSKTALSSLTSDSVSAAIDLSALKEEGDYIVPVTIELPSGLTVTDDVEITIHLKKKAEASSTSAAASTSAE
ncbi:MAG: CdaR family protein [Eubacterium sp.]|nr:CdaR family protein [Eubacterium sp.]